MKTNTLIFYLFFYIQFMFAAANADALKFAEFQDPPNEARPRAYLCWVNGNFDLTQIAHELKEAKEKGMGGFDIWDVGTTINPDGRVPAGPVFMGDESVQAIAFTVREATKLGLDIGLTISSSWNAGGSWVKPEHGAMGLFRSRASVKGPSEFNGVLPFPELPERYDPERKTLIEKDSNGLPTFYREVAVLAVPVSKDSNLTDMSRIFDISDKLKQNGQLDWTVPAGDWEITRYVCAPTGQPLMIPSPNSVGRMIDHFSAGAMETHLLYFIEKLRKELGSFEGTALKHLYTDSYEVNSAIWTPKLPEEFEKRNGYSLVPYLPVLDGFTVINKEITERFVFDLKKTLSDLNIENHYGFGKVICNKYGLDFIAEAGGPGPPVHNCPFEALKSLGSLDVPRGEFWYEHPRGDKHMHELQIIKGPASAAHLYDQKYVEAEAFTSVWLWQEGPGDIKMVADKAMCEGLNRFIYHTFPHIPPEAGLPGWVYNFGTLINTTRTWWPKSAAFHNYLARCCYMLQQGHFVGDVLYYYGDQAPNFVDPKHIDPSLGPGYDYDVCNSEIILDHLDVEDGRLVLPHGQSYEILVLPEQDAVNPEVLDKIKRLAQKGATIVGRKPARSHSLNDFEQNDIRVQKLAAELWGNIDGVDITEHQYGNGKIIWGKTLRNVLLERGITPDFETSRPDDSTMPDYIHRRSGKADIYFIRNVNNFKLDTDVLFRVSGKVPELWDPDKGTKTGQYVYADDGKRIRMPLQLPPLGSVFVVFREAPGREYYHKVFMDKKQVFPLPEEGKKITRPKGLCVDQTGILTSGSPGQYRLVSGRNKEYNITIPELSPAITIDGSWEVRFPHGHGAPGRVNFPELISWTESEENGIRYFSGIAAYHKTITLADDFSTENKKIVLDLGHVSKVADVYVNGRHLGILWHSPWQVDITDAVKPGKNYLVIEVANVMSNQLTGDATIPEKFKRTNSNIIKGPNAWMTPWKDVPLVESGLMGPVKIKFLNRISL